jgi:hypothetical protein
VTAVADDAGVLAQLRGDRSLALDKYLFTPTPVIGCFQMANRSRKERDRWLRSRARVDQQRASGWPAARVVAPPDCGPRPGVRPPAVVVVTSVTQRLDRARPALRGAGPHPVRHAAAAPGALPAGCNDQRAGKRRGQGGFALRSLAPVQRPHARRNGGPGGGRHGRLPLLLIWPGTRSQPLSTQGPPPRS